MAGLAVTAELCELINNGGELNLDDIDAKSVLLYAAKNNLPLVVERLFHAGFDLNITDDEGKTAVFYANRNHSMDALGTLIVCDAEFKLDEIDRKALLFDAAENDYFGVVDKLHDKNFDLNITDDEGKTALFYANRNHSMNVLCELISCGAEFKLDDIDGKAVLFYAAKKNIFGVVARLHVWGFDLNITDDEGKTALFYANRNHSMNVLCELISCGAEFKLDDIDGKAVLFHAAKKNIFGVVARLHVWGFDLNVTDDEGKTALFYSNRNHSMDVLCELICLDAEFKLDEIDGKALLFHAAANIDLPPVVKRLINAGFDLNTTDDEGKTALFYANRNYCMDMLCKLIVCGAEFELDEIDGKAVLFYATKKNKFGVVIELRAFDLNITDDEGKTALFYANRNHSMNVLCELICCGAEFKLDEIDGKAVLFHAASNIDLPPVVERLFDAGFDLNTTDDEGKTAMFYANRNHSMDVLCELVFYDAKFESDEIDGKPVLFYAAKKNKFGVVIKLRDREFDLNITDDEGKTALFYANRNHSMTTLCELICLDAEFKLDEIDGKALLFHAAANIDLPAVVVRLINAGFDLNTTDDEGKTALFYANRNYCMDMLCKLIVCGAEFELDEIDGKAVLFYAAKNNIFGVVIKLRAREFDLNITDDEGKTALFYANFNQSLDVLCELICCDAEFKLDEIDGKALLFHAAANIDLPRVVVRLINAGFDLNTTDDEGKTPLFYANRNHSMDILCQFIYYDAEFELDEIDGKAVLFYAAKKSWFGVAIRLHAREFDLNITDDEGKTALFYANFNQSLDVLCELICCDAEFKLDEIDGKALLFCAANNDLPPVVVRLINAGIDLNITDDEGKTALFYANRNHSMAVLCELISCDAEFKLDEIDGKTVLFYAAKNDKFGVANMLHFREFDLNITDDEGKTALLYANFNQSLDVLCELIGLGAEFKLDDINGKAVLFHSVKNEHEQVVKPLYDAGLDLGQTDDHGKTVVFYGDEDFLDALKKVVDVIMDAKDHYGRTPLFYAVQDDDTSKARYLVKEGANLQLKDNCNVSIFTFFIETCISKKVEAMGLFTTHLFQEKAHRKALIHAIFNILYCQAPLLSLTSFSHLPKPYALFNETNVLEALAFARQEYVNQNSHKVENVDKVVYMIKEKVTDVPLLISSLIKLGADPQTSDSDGNTAFHYATLLPLYGVTQEVVMDICEKLQRFGTIFHAKNHQHQSPLLFCLSSNTWKVVAENNSWQSSIRGFVEICRFLLSNRNVMTNSESIFHRIISLIQQGLNLNEKSQRKAVVQVLVDILELLQPHQDSVRNAVNYTDTLLNSPLHLWASIALTTPQDYTGFGTEDFTFERILKRTLDHLLKCGAQRNARNVNDETPLHRCRTWMAMKLLLDAGANPNDQNSSGYSALLFAANKKYALTKPGHLYPDVTEDPKAFWNCAVQKGLDPWIFDKQGETIMNVLIKSEDYALSRGLVEVACNEESATDDVKLSILKAICNDESKHTHWKTILVDIILKSPGANRLALESPLRLCCRNMVKFGIFDDGQPVSEIQQRENDKPRHDDGQPLAKKARKDESENKEEKKRKSNEEQFSNNSVYCKIAKQLMGTNALDIDIGAIANDYPSLNDFLMKPPEIDDNPIPWTYVSRKHEAKLAKVARKQEVTVAGQIWYHKDRIGKGSNGVVFAGINTKDGGEVAVKRIDKSRLERPEDMREIENLVRLADCAQVVRYISFFENDYVTHVIQELMEGNLVEFLRGCKTDAGLATRLCKDVVLGLQFIHEKGILHRDLKPENILYKVHPKICLKIADFGLSRTIDSVSTSVFGTLAGSRCWMAPEVFTVPNSVDKTRFAKESDVFSCGIILHYILSGGKHPFSPKDCTNKNAVQVSLETETNIMNGNMNGWDNSLCPEATHLVKKMLERNESNRPSCAEASKHPFFWSNEKKLHFLFAVRKNRKFRDDGDHYIRNALRKGKHRASWIDEAYEHMKAFHVEMSRHNYYYRVESVVDLVRFIRNVYEHYQENNLRHYVGIERLLFTDYVFFNNFPNLVLEVYKYVTKHELDEAPEFKRVMNKEY